MEADHANGCCPELSAHEGRHFARVNLKGPTRTGSHLLPEILRDHIFAVPGAMAKPRSRSARLDPAASRIRRASGGRAFDFCQWH